MKTISKSFVDSSDYDLSDIGKVEMVVSQAAGLEQTHTWSDVYQLGLVDTFAEEIKEQLERKLAITSSDKDESSNSSTNKPFTLKVRIIRCKIMRSQVTQSRYHHLHGRGARGKATTATTTTAKVFLKWEVIDSFSKELLFGGPETEKMIQAGTAIGIAEMLVASLFGRRVFRCHWTPQPRQKPGLSQATCSQPSQ